jgi:hypothetical protein
VRLFLALAARATAAEFRYLSASLVVPLPAFFEKVVDPCWSALVQVSELAG